MPVIVMASSKGGAGKTTATLIVAGELADNDVDITLIDADPNRPLVEWAERPHKPDKITVIADESVETIVDNIDEARGRAKFVIVDLEGTANDRVGFAIARADLVLIPVQASVLDATEAAKSIKLIKRMGRTFNRTIPYRVFFSRIPAALRERTHRDIEEQFAGGNVPLLKSALIDRAAYRAFFSFGGTVRTLQPDQVSGLPAAQENAYAFTQEIVNVLAELRNASAAA